MPHFYTLRTRLLFSLSFLLFFSLFGLTKSWGQTYATAEKDSSLKVITLLGGADVGNPYVAAGNLLDPTYSTVTNGPFAVDANYTNYATMTASSSSALVAGARGYSMIRFNFGSVISANKTVYIRIDQPTVSGTGLSLLSIVGDLTNLISKTIIYGKTYIDATNTTPISGTTSALVKDIIMVIYI